MKSGFVVALLAAVVFVSCGEPSPRTESMALPDPRSAADATVVPPAIVSESKPSSAVLAAAEAKPMLVGIESSEPGIVFSYTYSNYAYTDTYGFNTYVYKFYSNSEGFLIGCIAYELRKEGERERERFAFTRPSGGNISVESNLAGGKAFGIYRKGDSLEAESSGANLSVSALAGRGIRLERRYGARTVTEDWPDSLEAESRISENGSLVAIGKFTAKGAGGTVYTETPIEGADAIEYEIKFVRDSKGIAFKTDSLAPLSACRVAGAEGLLSGSRLLENAILLEVIVGERGRISPFLAYMSLK